MEVGDEERDMDGTDRTGPGHVVLVVSTTYCEGPGRTSHDARAGAQRRALVWTGTRAGCYIRRLIADWAAVSACSKGRDGGEAFVRSPRVIGQRGDLRCRGAGEEAATGRAPPANPRAKVPFPTSTDFAVVLNVPRPLASSSRAHAPPSPSTVVCGMVYWYGTAAPRRIESSVEGEAAAPLLHTVWHGTVPYSAKARQITQGTAIPLPPCICPPMLDVGESAMWYTILAFSCAISRYLVPVTLAACAIQWHLIRIPHMYCGNFRWAWAHWTPVDCSTANPFQPPITATSTFSAHSA